MRISIRRLMVVLWVTAVMLFPASEVSATLIGDTIKPFASITEMYDSNIFRVRDKDQLMAINGGNQMGDFITILSAGTDVHYEISKQIANLMIRKDFLRYINYTDQNASRDEAKADVTLAVIDRFRIKMLGSYDKTPVPRTDYQSSGLNKSTDTNGGITVQYEMPTGITLEAAYGRHDVRYSLEEFKANEYSSDQYSATASYRISTETRLYSTLQREYTRYKEEQLLGFDQINNNSVSDSVRIGIEKTVGAKTAVSAYIGYLTRQHKEASERDFSGIIGKVEVTYGLTAKLGLLVNAERLLYEEIDPNRTYSVTDSVGAGLIYEITEKTRVRLFDKFSWKYFKNIPDTEATKRTDHIQEISAGVQWLPIKAVTVDVAYQYASRGSTEDTLRYKDHTAMASVAYHF